MENEISSRESGSNEVIAVTCLSGQVSSRKAWNSSLVRPLSTAAPKTMKTNVIVASSPTAIQRRIHSGIEISSSLCVATFQSASLRRKRGINNPEAERALPKERPLPSGKLAGPISSAS
jgi:hypothetical protein